MEYTQQQLEEMVVGKPIDPTIEFYEQALLDIEESKRLKRRVYQDVLMIKRRVPGVTDFVAQRAQPEDIARWPAEYQAYKTTVQTKKSPGLEVIYGISNVQRQELIDRGYSTVERLATATDVPEHLAHLQPSARRIHEAIQAEEQHNAQQEENNQQEASEARELPAPRRRDDRPDVEQPRVPEVRPRGSERSAEGHEAGRRQHGGAEVNNIDNWSIEL